MAIHYIVTVGTSLLESPCFLKDERLNRLVESLTTGRTEWNPKVRAKIKTMVGDLFSECGNGPEMFLERYPFNEEMWKQGQYRFLGAELATLRKIIVLEQEIQAEDRISLMATPEEDKGGWCGTLLKLILSKLLPKGVTIDVDYTEALDIRVPTTFNRGMEEIRRKVMDLIESTEDDVWLVLSGGYKVVAMLLAQLQIHEIYGTQITVAALHEEGFEGIIRLSPLQHRDVAEREEAWPSSPKVDVGL